MTQALNISIALCKQIYDELMGLTNLDALESQDFGEGAKRDRVESLLEKLNLHINAIRRELSGHVVGSESAPVLDLPAAHRNFYNEILKIHGPVFQRAYYHSCGMGLLARFVESADDEPPANDKAYPAKVDAMRVALQRWADDLDDDDLLEKEEQGLDIAGALNVLNMPWFEPDQWMHNFKLLQPVIVDRPSNVMNEHVRNRLNEIYKAFAFELWMSAIALSRSLVEYSIKQNANRLGIELEYEFSQRRKEKNLKELGDELTAIRPELAEAFDMVREAGNRILHPKKMKTISHPTSMRSEALGCIRSAQLLIESVFSVAPHRD
jgi:hypothetical protein